MSEKQIAKRLKELEAMTGPNPGRTKIPVSDFVQEAQFLHAWCQSDKSILIKAGLKWELVEDLQTRIDALRVSQAEWKADFKRFRVYDSEWRTAVRKAVTFRDKLIHHFFFAFHENKKAYSKLKKIARRSSNDKLVKNLTDLAILGRKHKKELKVTGFSLSLLDDAMVKSEELSRFIAKANSITRETDPKLLLRNKANQHLKEAVDEIRRVGKFKFGKHHMRRPGYVSSYVKKVNTTHNKKKKRSGQEGNE